MREVFRSLRTDKETADWVRKIIQLKAEHGQDEHIQAQRVKRRRMNRQEKRRKELLEMRLDGQIKQDMYDAKDSEYETEWLSEPANRC